MKQYPTPREREISSIVVSCMERWGREFMSDVLISKEGITDDTTLKEVVTQKDGTYDDSCRLELLNDCEDRVFGGISDIEFEDIKTVGELIDRFIYLDKTAAKEIVINGITWSKIEVMPDHCRDGRDVLLHYDLGTLSKSHPRVIIGWYDKKRNIWVWQGRACRAYSECYQPNYYAEIDVPEGEEVSDTVSQMNVDDDLPDLSGLT